MISSSAKISKSIIKRFNNYIDIARGLKGNCQTGRAFHITVITQKAKILAIGINNYNRKVFKTKFGKYKVYGADSYKPCLHSEISALLKLGREDCSDLNFFNIRIDNNGNIASSKPCENCQAMLDIIGYKYIYYINEQGKLDKI